MGMMIVLVAKRSEEETAEGASGSGSKQGDGFGDIIRRSVCSPSSLQGSGASQLPTGKIRCESSW